MSGPLPDSGSAWQFTQLVFAGGTTTVTGIWFGALGHGVCVATGAYEQVGAPGAVLQMVAPLQMAPTPLFNGDLWDSDGGPDWEFDGLVPSSYGLVVLTDMRFLLASTDDGSSAKSLWTE